MNFKSFPVADIWYDKEARQRKDVGDVSDLAASIAAVGLINPLVITKEGELITGERRLTAVKSLGWLKVPVQFREDLSALDRERIELDENIKRLDLTWQEKTLAIARYHDLCLKTEEPGWTQEATADRLGLALITVQQNLMVARSMSDPRIAESPLFSTARGMVERASARQRDSEKESLASIILPGIATPSAESINTILAPRPAPAEFVPILNASFIDWYKDYSGPKFNLIHCDFPYGIGATEDKNKQYAKGFGEYADNASDFMSLIDALELSMSTVVAESAHLIFWFPTKEYSMVAAHLTRLGWTVNPTPFVWHRSDGSGILPDPRRMPRQIYETAFLAARGDRFLVQARANLFSAANNKEWHMSEKPKDMLAHLLSMFVDETTTMLDPTCGSGNAVIVANKLGAKSVLGIEQSTDFWKGACENWKKEQREDAST